MVRNRPISQKRKLKKKQIRPFYKKIIFYFLCISLVFLYALYLWHRLFISPHKFYYMSIMQNGEIKKILDGDTLRLYPKDRVKILHISTNIPFNLHVRLFCKELDIMSLVYEEKMIFSLLPNKDMFNLYKPDIWVKFKNQDIGHVTWIIKPSFEDWVNKLKNIKELDKKRAFLKKGFSLFPEKQNELIDLSLSLAQEYTKKGMPKKAIKEYLKILHFSENLNKETLISIYETLGYLCTEIKRYKDAITYYQMAIDMGDKNPEIYYNMYELYSKLGDEARASYYFSKLLQLKPKDLESRIEFAKTLFKKGALKEAEKYVEEALSINPNSLEALVLKAKILEKKGNKNALVDIYKRILLIEPGNEIALYNLAVLEYESQKIDDALIHIKTYIEKKPEDKDAHELLFQIYRAKKMDEMAYKEAKILIKLNPRLTYPYYFLFSYLWPKGKCREILSYMIKGIRYNPKDVTLRKYIVLCYLYQGKDALAIKHIRYILKLKPNDVGTLLQLARLMEKRGDYSEALELYKRVIKLSPENEEAQNAYLRLRFKMMEQKQGEE